MKPTQKLTVPKGPKVAVTHKMKDMGWNWEKTQKLTAKLGKKEWKPEINNSDAFWYIDSFLEPENDTIGVRIPKLRKGYIASGNYFRTRKLAQAAAKAVRTLLKQLNHG